MDELEFDQDWARQRRVVLGIEFPIGTSLAANGRTGEVVDYELTLEVGWEYLILQDERGLFRVNAWDLRTRPRST